jgi:septal ring factor EnvC (AmiA/AmiB activator)
MAKEILKQDYIERKGLICALCGQEIVGEYSLLDTDRINPKANGGTYDIHNYRVAHPVCRMKHHKIYKKRGKIFEELKALLDDREQIRKTYNKINNQMLAYKRKTDNLNIETLEFLKDESKKLQKILSKRDSELKRKTKEIAQVDQLAASALGVKGVGPVTIAYCLIHVDLEKARHASSLWKYVGLHAPSHQRYTKNQPSGGNKTLRTALYTMADSQVKTRGAYRHVYDREREKKKNSTEKVKSRNTKGHLIECEWKDAKPCHHHGHALRVVIKHFLADYWMAGRTIKGLPTTPLYPEAVLKSGHRTIMPEDRGWIYK